MMPTTLKGQLLLDPQHNIHKYSIWIEFHVTNNITKYEATQCHDLDKFTTQN